ncbi:hypothetical protein O7600_15540 [Micromonospora sp. WMMA1998]|uniref:hypothetical protein n=1 Tax=Micromonospora sp. WMMA1998 TaxID=3015167 RepID=UPI00248B07ED|nr:hypothetical protein [Micromonospora sp. WMMA1998]WBC12600.1 hypothetical protein O7600_15540 [Micromonospora sp. WMMA1998]
MAGLIVEIHVPLVPGGRTADAYPFPWIDDVEALLGDLEEQGEIEVIDEGEECDDVYVFAVGGADEAGLLAAASRVAALDGVPGGAFAVVTDDETDEIGQGRRVNLAR